MAEKKASAGPDKRMAFLGLAMIAIGVAWFIWGAFLRPPTEEEIKIAKEDERDRIRKEREEAKRPKPRGGGH